MKIRQAPMTDLIKYVTELYDHPEDSIHDNIISLIDEYYCKLTHYKTIIPVGASIMSDWCDMNYSDTMENCPYVPGLIIYKKINNKYEYGLLYHSGYILPKDQQTLNMSYYQIDDKGHVTSHTFLNTDWDGWGAPIRYFYFNLNEYTDNNSWSFGERELMKHTMGHDVKMLQILFKQVFPEFIITGYFDDNTLKTLHDIQTICNVPKTDSINFNTRNGKKVISFITNESPDIILPG